MLMTNRSYASIMNPAPASTVVNSPLQHGGAIVPQYSCPRQLRAAETRTQPSEQPAQHRKTALLRPTVTNPRGLLHLRSLARNLVVLQLLHFTWDRRPRPARYVMGDHASCRVSAGIQQQLYGLDDPDAGSLPTRTPVAKDTSPDPRSATDGHSPCGLANALRQAMALHSDRPCLGFPFQELPSPSCQPTLEPSTNGLAGVDSRAHHVNTAWTWRWLSYRSVFRLAQAFQAGLLDMLAKPQGQGVTDNTGTHSCSSSTEESTPFVAVCGPNRLEWYLSDLAAATSASPRVVTVPLRLDAASDVPLAASTLSRIAWHKGSHPGPSAGTMCHLRAVITSPEAVEWVHDAMAAAGLPPSTPVVVMDLDVGGGAGFTHATTDDDPARRLVSFASLIESGSALCQQQPMHTTSGSVGRPHSRSSSLKLFGSPRRYSHEDIFSVVFTSGSTGEPKGVPLLRETWLSELAHYPAPVLVACSYQPLSYITDRHHVHATWWNGGRVAVLRQGSATSGAPQPTLFEAFSSVQPTIVFGVPRVFDVLVRMCKDAASSCPSTAPKAHRDAAARLLGNRCKTLVVGGGALSTDTETFLRDTLGVTVVQGYGSTESGNIALNGTVRPTVDVRLVAAPDHGMSPTDSPHPRGEVQVRTPGMFPGYFNDDAATAAAFTEDGWFRIGDLGILENDPQGGQAIRVVGRVGQGIKLARGEFVNAQSVEQALVEYGGGALAAVCVLSPSSDAAATHLVAVVVAGNVRLGSATAEADMLRVIRRAGVAAGLKSHEIPQRVVLAREDFTTVNRQLSHTGKLVRSEIRRAYAHALAADATSGADTSGEDACDDLWISALEDTFTRGVCDLDHQPKMPPWSDADLSFTAMGGDSMAAARVASWLSRTLGVAVAPALLLGEAATFTSVCDHVKTLRRRVPGDRDTESAERTAAMRMLSSVTPTLDDLTVPIDVGGASYADGPMVLLTGATGFMGPHLLARLITTHPTRRVTCLVRADSSHRSAMKKLWRAVVEAGLEDELATARDSGRIVAVGGDLELPLLGLPVSRLPSILSGLECIVHAGAKVDLARPVASMWQSNALACVEVARLAVAASRLSGTTPPRTLYLSTLDTLRPVPTREGPVSKIELGNLADQEPYVVSDAMVRWWSGYALSKAAGERALAHCDGIGAAPTAIVRLGFVGPHTQSGQGAPADFVTRFLRGVAQVGFVPEATPLSSAACPDSQGRFLAVLPVDVAAAAVVVLADTAPTGQAYHVQNIAGGSAMGDVFEAMTAEGVPLRAEGSYEEWCGAVLHRSSHNPLVSVWDWTRSPAVGSQAFRRLPSLASTRRLACANTLAALRKQSFGNRSLLESMTMCLGVDYWRRVMRWVKRW